MTIEVGDLVRCARLASPGKIFQVTKMWGDAVGMSMAHFDLVVLGPASGAYHFVAVPGPGDKIVAPVSRLEPVSPEELLELLVKVPPLRKRVSPLYVLAMCSDS